MRNADTICSAWVAGAGCLFPAWELAARKPEPASAPVVAQGSSTGEPACSVGTIRPFTPDFLVRPWEAAESQALGPEIQRTGQLCVLRDKKQASRGPVAGLAPGTLWSLVEAPARPSGRVQRYACPPPRNLLFYCCWPQKYRANPGIVFPASVLLRFQGGPGAMTSVTFHLELALPRPLSFAVDIF